MKGPLESRHTSSERSAPGSSSHPGARSERVLRSQGRSTITALADNDVARVVEREGINADRSAEITK